MMWRVWYVEILHLNVICVNLVSPFRDRFFYVLNALPLAWLKASHVGTKMIWFGFGYPRSSLSLAIFVMFCF